MVTLSNSYKSNSGDQWVRDAVYTPTHINVIMYMYINTNTERQIDACIPPSTNSLNHIDLMVLKLTTYIQIDAQSQDTHTHMHSTHTHTQMYIMTKQIRIINIHRTHT